MRGPTPRYQVPPAVPGTVAMSAGGSQRPVPAEEGGLVEGGEEEEATAQAGLGSPFCNTGQSQSQACSAFEGAAADESWGSGPSMVRKAVRWMRNAISPKPELARQERRRTSVGPADFGSPGGGGAPPPGITRTPGSAGMAGFRD